MHAVAAVHEGPEELIDILGDILGEKPAGVGLVGLAGPNSIIQWIAKKETWIALGMFLAAEAGSTITENVTNRLTDAAIERLVAYVRDRQTEGFDVELRTSPTPEQPFDDAGPYDRGAYVSISNLPEKGGGDVIRRHIALMALHADRIEAGDVEDILDIRPGDDGHMLRYFKVDDASTS
ncbi:hypothetical protein [Brevundimonas sp. PWP3-1b1]|uniref:hypothetical protein n=1 Tax=unclassified Brevundimonas TaxID=2622653 RepID=UPI003CECD38C